MERTTNSALRLHHMLLALRDASREGRPIRQVLAEVFELQPGWLVFASLAHLVIDVVARAVRGKRPLGLETDSLRLLYVDWMEERSLA